MKTFEAKHYLVQAQMLWDRVETRESYPFHLPVMQGFHDMTFHPKVTFLVGENGFGKSTLIEALTAAFSTGSLASVKQCEASRGGVDRPM
jgi:predicted ATPase